MNHQKRNKLYLPKCSLGLATKDRARCESKDHRTHRLIYITGHAGRQDIVKFSHQAIIRVFAGSMVCLIEHK